MDIVSYFSTNIIELLGFVLDANQRIFWLYLVSSVLLAYGVYRFKVVVTQRRGFWRYLFPRNIYLAASAKQDYVIFIVNKFIKALLFPLMVFGAAPIALFTADVLGALFPQHQFLNYSAWQISLIFTAILFLWDDFTRFLLHFALHKIPFLWEFHKVHHSAKVLTPFTVYRSHPVENLLYACRMSLAQGLSIGIGFFLFGPSEHLNMWTILEANLFIFAFNVLGSNLRHSHIPLGFGDIVEKWLISPAQHQIHHSLEVRHFDTNFGTVLAVWDRLFKCLVLSSSAKNIKVGLHSSEAEHNSLAIIYWDPLCRSFKGILSLFKKQV